MRTSVALLRGVNVSGKKMILMKELEELFINEGMKNVTTYIQSGNVIFEHALQRSRQLEEKLEKAIMKRFGFDVPVIIRTASEMADVIESIPYSVDGERMLYVTFLKDIPDKELAIQLGGKIVNDDEVNIIDKHAYLLIRGGYGNTKLSNTFIEKKLGVTATTRNLKTVKKLKELTCLIA